MTSIAHPLWMKNIRRKPLFYLMLLPGVSYFIIFKYLPMWGVLIAFKDFQPFLGFFGSPWAGIRHFIRFFTEAQFLQLFGNTLTLAILNLLFFFPLPIILALLLNEVRNASIKRFIQTLVYVPHFMSWVVVVGITSVMVSTEGGVVNEILTLLELDEVPFLMSARWFRPLIVIQVIWKETGWGTIIFLAAIAGIDVQLYEAAIMDGANRFQQLLNVPFLRLGAQ